MEHFSYFHKQQRGHGVKGSIIRALKHSFVSAAVYILCSKWLTATTVVSPFNVPFTQFHLLCCLPVWCFPHRLLQWIRIESNHRLHTVCYSTWDYWSLSPWLWCNAYVGHGSETQLQPSFSVLLQTLLNWSLWWITLHGLRCLNFKLGGSLERLKQQWEYRRLSCTVILHCCMYCMSYMLHSSCIFTVYTLFTWTYKYNEPDAWCVA